MNNSRNNVRKSRSLLTHIRGKDSIEHRQDRLKLRAIRSPVGGKGHALCTACWLTSRIYLGVWSSWKKIQSTWPHYKFFFKTTHVLQWSKPQKSKGPLRHRHRWEAPSLPAPSEPQYRMMTRKHPGTHMVLFSLYQGTLGHPGQTLHRQSRGLWHVHILNFTEAQPQILSWEMVCWRESPTGDEPSPAHYSACVDFFQPCRGSNLIRGLSDDLYFSLRPDIACWGVVMLWCHVPLISGRH